MDCEIVVIGASLGGLKALQALLPVLPANFRVPVVIVQHRGKDSGESFEAFLQQYSPLPVIEAEDKTNIEDGRVYVAPADYHLLIGQGCFCLSTDAPVSNARPSIDVLFESAAEAYGGSVIAVILTGANHDGAEGAAEIARRGGVVLVQNPETAEARTMPDAVMANLQKNGCSVKIIPVGGIARLLSEISVCSSTP